MMKVTLLYLFQSTRPQGARLENTALNINSKAFQSTRPQGARPVSELNAITDLGRFNPRARKERDPKCRKQYQR